MKIDWFTVIAQILNFLVLVWLLKRFLYKPVLQAIEKRETLVADQLQQAADKETEAEKQRQAYQQSQQELEQEQVNLRAKMTADAKAERQKLLQQAQQDAASLRARLQQTLAEEQQKWSKEIMRQTLQEAFAIAGQVLHDLSGTSLEQNITSAFIQRLQALSPEEKERMLQGHNHQQPAVVQSAYPLPAPQQDAIAKAITEISGNRLPIQFAINPDLVNGITLLLNGNSVSWNVQDYLASMEKSITDHLEHESDAADRKQPEPQRRD